MSQIHYATLSRSNGPVHVQTGWDRQMQRYHLTAWRLGNSEPFIEDMLSMPFTRAADVMRLLKAYDVPLPSSVAVLLLAHKISNAGNIIVSFPREEEATQNA